jgi:hypothetical protein
MTEPLQPPMLTPPEPVAVVAPQDAANRVPVPPAEVQRLDAQVAGFIGDLTSLDPHGGEFRSRVDAIVGIGDTEVRQSASVANRMLERPMSALKDGVFDGSSPVSKALLDLRSTVESLDPSRQGDLLSPRKLLGMIPMGIARPSRISTASSKRCTDRKTNCSATTRRSSKRRPACGA